MSIHHRARPVLRAPTAAGQTGDSRNRWWKVGPPRLQSFLGTIDTTTTGRCGHDEPQESRSQPTQRPQEHRAQDARGEGCCQPQRYDVRSPLTRCTSSGEDEVALKELSECLRAKLQPVGELESQLVDQIIATAWRSALPRTDRGRHLHLGTLWGVDRASPRGGPYLRKRVRLYRQSQL